jgi:hypothetical protein
MPPANYLITHPDARLTDAEKTALARGLQATVGASPEAGEHEEGD